MEPNITVPNMPEHQEFMDAIKKVSENFNILTDFVNHTKEPVSKRNGALIAINQIQTNLNQITFLYASSKVTPINSTETIKDVVRETLSQTETPLQYSQALKSVKSAPVNLRVKQKFKAIVYPKPGNKNIKTSDDTKRELEKKLNPFELNITPSRLIKVRNNGILIESEQDTLSKLVNNKKLDELNLFAETVNKFWPRISIVNVPKDSSEEDIRDAIFRQTMSPPDSQDKIKKIFRIGNPNSPSATWVVELEPKLKDVLITKGRLLLNWNACKIFNYIKLTRCYNCQRYGHTSKYCRSAKQCGFCASTDHESTACQHKHNPDKFNCANCLRSEHHKKHHNHNAADNSCPIYKSRLSDYIANIET